MTMLATSRHCTSVYLLGILYQHHPCLLAHFYGLDHCCSILDSQAFQHCHLLLLKRSFDTFRSDLIR